MKCVILAGGFGTRISEETDVKPKPMIEIGGKPIIWHIMKIYSTYGINDFVICLGYKGYMVKEYFANYFLHMSDVTIDIRNNKMETHKQSAEPWKVTLVDTGLETMTGGRLKRVKSYLNDETFCFTYGDGLSNVNMSDIISFHRNQKKLATVLAVQRPEKFGVMTIDNNRVSSFQEKPVGDHNWVNGGFFVLESGIFDYLQGDSTIWEREPLEHIVKDGQLSVYKHNAFWYSVDTLRDKKHVENLWNDGKAPWKVW